MTKSVNHKLPPWPVYCVELKISAADSSKMVKKLTDKGYRGCNAAKILRVCKNKARTHCGLTFRYLYWVDDGKNKIKFGPYAGYCINGPYDHGSGVYYKIRKQGTCEASNISKGTFERLCVL